jgi:hypothetical protein
MAAMRDNRVDVILMRLSILHANLGTDSTQEEIQAVKNEEEYLKSKVAEIDQELAERLFP